MRQITLLAALALAVLSIGCGDNLPQHRVGAVNNYTLPPCETLTLGVSTVHSSARLTLGIDTWGVNIQNLTGTASGTYTIEGSNDNTNWFSVTLPASPPALASGAPASIPIEYDGGWPWAYWRATYVGSSGTGTSSICVAMKG